MHRITMLHVKIKYALLQTAPQAQNMRIFLDNEYTNYTIQFRSLC